MVRGEVQTNLIDQVTDVMIHRPTAPTNHVEVIVGMSDLPSRRAVDPELGLPDEVEVFEQRQRSIDGGQVDRRVGLMDLLGDLLGGQVPVGRAEDGPNQPPRARQAVPVVPEQRS